ncbi:NPCBM/NEW2 domain-containing protein [Paludisphaera borealis]|uniref:NPCBM containing protein n=1 Tax=Paludisphaera borealis TaxID=1387353 RepID=A0A1U7CNE2_9BACT|nr:NPCBM/NEW2 domain-containing protein [Paludisphaera borealis]APW60403.1 NPCBM containing protein [Paludisphaera borealis]
MLSGVGVNLLVNYQYQGDAVWTNVSRLMGEWGDINKANWWTADPSLPTNSLNSPLVDASTYAYLTNYPDGVYQVSYEGTATLDFWGVGHLVSPLVKGADGVTRGQVKVSGVGDQSGQRALVMDVTAIDPNNPLADLKIIAPGYAADGSQPFTSGFLKDLQPFDNIRFMDWGLTNGSKVAHWSDRGQPDELLSTTPSKRPIDYETMIELGNEAHKDIWLNVPALADDDFIRNLATLVHDKLSPDLKVYIEYSNETWNTGFEQNAQILTAAKANPLVPVSTNTGTMVAQQTAFQLKKISDIFRQEFGADFDRVIPVLGGWTISPWVIQVGLQFIQDHYGAPDQFIKSTAIAPYFGLKSGTKAATLSASGFFTSINQYLDQAGTNIQNNVKVAAAFGLPLDAYEAGQGLTTPSSIVTTQAILDDPRMYDVYKRYISVWQKAGGRTMDFYTYSGDFWGLKSRVTSPGSQRWDAVVSTLVPGGDANLDGKVDFADFQILAANYNLAGRWWEQGDFNHDNKVDRADLDVLLAHINAGALTADQAAQIVTFAQPSAIAANQSIEFELFGRSYVGDLAFGNGGVTPIAVNATYNGTASGGGLASLGGVVYNKGVGVSSNSKVVVPLNGAYTSFDAIIGVDDSAGAGVGKSVFQVIGDGKILYTSAVMTAGSSPAVIDVAVKGVKTLLLVVTTTGGASAATPADWAMARLVNSPSTSAVSPTKLAWTVTKNGNIVTSTNVDSFVFIPSGAGNYVVSVQATDAYGAKATRSVEVNVTAASTATSAKFAGTDASTRGSWKGAYGGAGYSLAGSVASYPSYSFVQVSGQTTPFWTVSTSDVRALQKAPSWNDDRFAAAWSGNQFTIDVAFSDGLAHRVSLYAVDWDSSARSERIDVVNVATGKVIDSRTLSSFHNGVYTTWNITGHVKFVVTKLGGASAVVSGLFLDGTPSAAFVGKDTTTQGTWRGVYGSQGYNIANSGFNYPAYVNSVTMSGQTLRNGYWTSTDMVPLLKANPLVDDRLNSYWYGAQITIDVAFTDNLMHKLSIYAYDRDGSARTERIDVIDPNSGAVLDSQTLSSFQNGAYLTWNVSGHVKIRFTKIAGSNASVSGLFFG